MFLCVAEDIMFLTYNFLSIMQYSETQKRKLFLRRATVAWNSNSHTWTQILVCLASEQCHVLRTWYVHVYMNTILGKLKQMDSQTDRQTDSVMRFTRDVVVTYTSTRYGSRSGGRGGGGALNHPRTRPPSRSALAFTLQFLMIIRWWGNKYSKYLCYQWPWL